MTRDAGSERASHFFNATTGLLVLASVVSLLNSGNCIAAERAWEFSPYRVRVAVAVSPKCRLTADSEQRLSQAIMSGLELADLSIWNIAASPVPDELRYEAVATFESPDIVSLEGMDLVAIAKADQYPNLKVRKVDFLTTIVANENGQQEGPRVGICNPASTLLGQRTHALLQSHIPDGERQSLWQSIGSVLSANAVDPAELLASMENDELDVVIVRKLDAPTNVEHLDVVPIEQLVDYDKFMLVVVDSAGGVMRVRCREFDGSSRFWGTPIMDETRQPQTLESLTTDAVRRVFAPLVRIDQVEDKQVSARLRAGGLIMSPDSPGHLGEGRILQPVTRRLGRNGELLEGSVEIVPWTYLLVDSREGSVFDCTVHSALRNALGGRRSRRMQRMALAVRPTGEQTQLKLETYDDPPVALSDYEIYERDKESGDSVLLGRTDWQGGIEIEKTDDPIRVLFVKSGARLIARLPVVPGLEATKSAQMINDTHRLWAEGRIRTLRSEFLDLVARRQTLAIRIRRRLETERLAEAAELLKEIETLPSQSDFRSRLRNLSIRVKSDDERTQAKIEHQLEEIRLLISTHLDAQLQETLRAEVRRAKQAVSM